MFHSKFVGISILYHLIFFSLYRKVMLTKAACYVKMYHHTKFLCAVVYGTRITPFSVVSMTTMLLLFTDSGKLKSDLQWRDIYTD